MFREAIQINDPGKAQLVTAIEMEGKYRRSISAKRKMFVCPDCCEYVAFVYCRHKNSYFKHEKSDGTRKCDIYIKRINSNSNNKISPYEKAGLPLYLLKYVNSYCINIGFYPISKKAMEIAVADKLSLSIYTEDGFNITTKFINEESFLSDTISFVQIDRISRKYRIKFNKENLPDEIAEKWAVEIEGIDDRGAFFKYNEYGGMKIRESEAITMGVDYYLVSKYAPAIDGAVFKKIGEINLVKNSWNKSVFGVYIIKFTEINQQNERYCLKNFGLFLVNDSPRLNPIWPPCNKNEQLYVYRGEKLASFFFNVCNKAERKLFLYPEKSVTIEHLDENKSIALIPVDNTERTVSVGRANNVFYFSVVVRESSKTGFDFKVSAEDGKSKIYESGEHVELPYNNRIRIITGFKVTIHVYYYDNLEYKRCVNDSVWIDNIRYGSVIKVFHGLDPVFELKFKRANKTGVKGYDDNFIRELISYRGNQILTPVSFKYILPRLIHKPVLYEYVKKAIKTGYINKTAMQKILKIVYRGKVV
jgi:hypothetical protein